MSFYFTFSDSHYTHGILNSTRWPPTGEEWTKTKKRKLFCHLSVLCPSNDIIEIILMNSFYNFQLLFDIKQSKTKHINKQMKKPWL